MYQHGTSLVIHTVKSLPTVRKTQARSLGREDPLEKEMATHSGILAWKIPWTEEPGRLQSTVRKELEMTEQLHFRINKCIVRTGTQKGLRVEPGKGFCFLIISVLMNLLCIILCMYYNVYIIIMYYF